MNIEEIVAELQDAYQDIAQDVPEGYYAIDALDFLIDKLSASHREFVLGLSYEDQGKLAMRALSEFGLVENKNIGSAANIFEDNLELASTVEQVLNDSRMNQMAFDIENMHPVRDAKKFSAKYGMSIETAREKMLVDVNEAQEGALSGSALVDNLSSICLSTWYELTASFKAKPDVYDIHSDETHEKYNVLKMTPGNDVINDVFEKVQGATTKLTTTLNRAFGKDGVRA